MGFEHTVGPGTVVVFLCADDPDSRPFARGVVVGRCVRDPETGDAWAPVLRPRRPPDLVAVALIVRAIDPATGAWRRQA